ncbi:MAG TPA: lysine exporter LysO family protein [Tissierellia bacterium]|nr:lysine exporter LysO family protein [Tissierellia bacterium]
MGIRLIIYFLILFLGFIIGHKDKINDGLYRKINILQNVCLYVLLFIMGIRIGLDDSVISSFLSIGYMAVVITLITLIVTIGIVRLLSKLILNRKGEDKIEL